MSVTVNFDFYVNGALTDVTSAVLSDATGAYGIKRDDTDAVVVADGTAMTHVTTGQYEYEFDEPAAGLTYTYDVEYVYAGDTYRSSYTYTDATRVISIADMKTHLRVDDTDSDEYIGDLIDAVTAQCELLSGEKFLTATCTDYLDSWPRTIEPRWAPLSSVDSITYVDCDGDTQTLADTEYRVDTHSKVGRVTEAYDCDWPDIRAVTNAIAVTYVAGYGTSGSDVPGNYQTAIRLWVADLFGRRGEVTQTWPVALPPCVTGLLALTGVPRC